MEVDKIFLNKIKNSRTVRKQINLLHEIKKPTFAWQTA